jgi:hypothetical protein
MVCMKVGKAMQATKRSAINFSRIYKACHITAQTQNIPAIEYLKGSPTRDFQLQVFSMLSVSSGSLSIPLGPFRIFSKIRVDTVFGEKIFIGGVTDTGYKREKF